MNKKWDPEDETEQNDVSDVCRTRINKDLRSIYSDPPPGICVVPDNDDITKVYALITGPFDTPYEGGFFLFYVRFPYDYPLRPPRVKLKTTGSGTVRFNPNFYVNGKVCLSILGTWDGPQWQPVSSLSSVLISIQSLMNERPYFNEPGFSVERSPGDAQRYNDIIRHETIRCAVCDVLEGRSWCPSGLMDLVKTNFRCYYDHYIDVCQSNSHLSGNKMLDPAFNNRGTFDYSQLQRRLERINKSLEASIAGDSDTVSG